MYKLYKDDFQNVDVGVVDFILTDIPYNIGCDAYASNPKWWKDNHVQLNKECYLAPYTEMLDTFNKTYGKGNYVVIDTSGGYHVLVKTNAIYDNPHDICKEVQNIYTRMVDVGAEPYINEKGECKFECVINDSQIPGLPLPGTYQYGREVRVLNKEDFE